MIRFLLICSCLSLTAYAKDYSGYKVIRVTPDDESSRRYLNNLADKFDFWQESKIVGSPADIMVSAGEYPMLASKLEQLGYDVSTMINDVQPLFDAQRAPSTSAAFDYNTYHTLDEITDWMEEFVAENSNFAVLEEFAITYEGRSIKKIKMSSNLSDQTKPIFFVIGGTHAREWVTPAAMIYTAKFLIDNYVGWRSDNLLDTMEFHIVPVFNQDGYVHTWDSDRMWRKTRSPSSWRCQGTDPNRNYDCQWGTGGSSSNPCSDTYMGTSPASEIEISNMQDHILSIKDRVKVFMDVHAYSQYWMYPYGYTTGLPADNDELYEASRVAVNAIRATHGKWFQYGSIANVIYVASGSSADWGYDVAGIKHSYALELRDRGQYGFSLPADQIQPTSEEFYAGVDALVRHLNDNGSL
ncbi:Carboxypeptidase A1 [Holothuria leucospilota]|uniref:Carboxypeptidase A1 n=1 Tax=Holothuria leucospilota TaxID=206669 RepID=A0A9Q0YDD9_HOLLE|nr:Carboxypeptidase A1 [Holothuria leucospilota]